MIPFRYILIISFLMINTTATPEANAMENVQVQQIIQKIETYNFFDTFDPTAKVEALCQEHGAAGLLLAEILLRRDERQIISLIETLEETRSYIFSKTNNYLLIKELIDLQSTLESKILEITILLSQYSDQ